MKSFACTTLLLAILAASCASAPAPHPAPANPLPAPAHPTHVEQPTVATALVVSTAVVSSEAPAPVEPAQSSQQFGGTIGLDQEIADTEERELRAIRSKEGASVRLPADLIKTRIKRRLGPIKLCYETALRTSPSLAGSVTVNFTIGLDGTVTSAAGTTDQLDQSVVNCVVDEVKRIQFPKPEGGTVRVRYPFSFSPASE